MSQGAAAAAAAAGAQDAQPPAAALWLLQGCQPEHLLLPQPPPELRLLLDSVLGPRAPGSAIPLKHEGEADASLNMVPDALTAGDQQQQQNQALHLSTGRLSPAGSAVCSSFPVSSQAPAPGAHASQANAVIHILGLEGPQAGSILPKMQPSGHSSNRPSMQLSSSGIACHKDMAQMQPPPQVRRTKNLLHFLSGPTPNAAAPHELLDGPSSSSAGGTSSLQLHRASTADPAVGKRARQDMQLPCRSSTAAEGALESRHGKVSFAKLSEALSVDISSTATLQTGSRLSQPSASGLGLESYLVQSLQVSLHGCRPG